MRKKVMNKTLKPCPFCGRIPHIEDCGDNRYFIKCECGINQDKLYTQRCDAVKAWNKRMLPKLVDELQAMLEAWYPIGDEQDTVYHEGIRTGLDIAINHIKARWI